MRGDRRRGARALWQARRAGEQRGRAVLRACRVDRGQGVERGVAAERGRHDVDVARGSGRRHARGRVGHDRERDVVAPPRHARDGALRSRAGRGGGDHARDGG